MMMLVLIYSELKLFVVRSDCRMHQAYIIVIWQNKSFIHFYPELFQILGLPFFPLGFVFILFFLPYSSFICYYVMSYCKLLNIHILRIIYFHA